MLIRIPALLFLLSIIFSSVDLLIEKHEDAFYLNSDPLVLATASLNENRMEEAVYLAGFSEKYLPADPEYSAEEIKEQANQYLSSNQYLFERMLAGAISGEADNTPELIGSLLLDMFMIGDIRDLLVQGYREYDSGDGDEFVMGLSAAGLLLTLAPELSWVPALFKSFWRGKRFSKPFQKYLKDTLVTARKTGDFSQLKKVLIDFSDTVSGLGVGPAMRIMPGVRSSDEMALLATKSKFAPMETFSLVRINGIKSLDLITETTVKQTKKGKLLKKIKISARQQKVFGKTLRLIPVGWLIGGILLSVLLGFRLIVGKREFS